MSLILYSRFWYGKIYGLVSLFLGGFYPHLHVTPVDLTGKTVIVTGGNSGIGYEIVKQLAAMGATVYIACRSATRGEKAVKDILNAVPGAKLHVMELDTSSFASVRKFADEWKALNTPIDILVHNAGIPSPPANKPFTVDGFESTYQINFLSSFLFTHLLEDRLSPNARVVFTSSGASYAAEMNLNFSLKRTQGVIEKGFHTGDLSSNSAFYYCSKLMQVVFSRALQRRFREDTREGSRVANCFNPGLNATPLFQETLSETGYSWTKDPIMSLLDTIQRKGYAMPTSQGAACGVWLATTNAKDVTVTEAGGYWERQQRFINPVDLYSDEQVDRFWIRWCADANIDWV